MQLGTLSYFYFTTDINIMKSFSRNFDFSFSFFTLTCYLEGGKMESVTCK